VTETWRALVAGAVADGLEPTEARWIGEDASGAEGAAWTAALDEPALERPAARFRSCVARRRTGEPLQYVLGHWSFRRLDLLVDRRVLIPRPETEWVVEQALTLLPRPLPSGAVVVDLGTGSGAIGLAIAEERWPKVRVVATDASADALAVARANLAGIGRRGTTVELRQGSWWDALPPALRGAVDLVVSNPPYVAPADPLPAEVADWEPIDALVPGPTGLEALEVILGAAGEWLRPGGWVVCEIGETQGASASALAAAGGLVDVEVRPDLTGRDRMVLARRLSR
jgi:release factor glutamine methyltransferase